MGVYPVAVYYNKTQDTKIHKITRHSQIKHSTQSYTTINDILQMNISKKSEAIPVAVRGVYAVLSNVLMYSDTIH
jgi:hypothetical protein